MLIVILGVTGSGKTTIGSLLARRLSLPFVDADDHHPLSNIVKMENGIPLDDSDRAPWLVQLNAILKEHEKRGLVLACSALKEVYRKKLQEGIAAPLQWFYLDVDPSTLQKRMAARKNHFMSPTLLASQLDSFEEPENAFRIDGERPPGEITSTIIKLLEE